MWHLLWIPLFAVPPLAIIVALVWFDQGFSPVEGEDDNPRSDKGGRYASDEVPF